MKCTRCAALLERLFTRQVEIVGGHGANRPGVEQMTCYCLDRDASLRAVGALQDFVEQVDEGAIAWFALSGIDHALQARERRHEVRHAVLERVLDPDARLKVAGRKLQ